MATMYERFTDRARKVMQLANQEAQRFNHEYIGTEHILLGLVKEGSGVAANVLKNLDIDLPKIRLEVEKIVQPGPDMVTMNNLPQTPRAKKVIEYSIEEARNHNHVGTEHLLLGLLREQEGVAAQILMNLGLQLEDVREVVLHFLKWDCLPQATVRHSPEAIVQRVPDIEDSDLPAEEKQALEALRARIGQLNQEMYAAIAEQDFEKCAHLRDQADRLKMQYQFNRRQWPTRYAIDPSWLSWNGGTVTNIAHVIYHERRWEDLPILADALEEAGCTHQEILGHCRQPEAHTRTCWVVNLLLGNV